MENTPLMQLMLSSLAGGCLGALYFVGLWFTVKRLAELQHPALWLIVSLFLRMAILLTALYWITDGNWQRLLAAMLGFFLVRFITTRILRPKLPAQTETVDGGTD